MNDELQQPLDEALETQPKPTAPTGADELARQNALIEKLRKENAERRVTAKSVTEENEALKAQLSELATVAETVKQLEARLNQEAQARQEAQLQTLRLQVASTVGIPVELAGRLQGSTLEELTADAQALASALPKSVVVPKVGQGAPVAPVSRVQELMRQTQGNSAGVFNPETHLTLKGGPR